MTTAYRFDLDKALAAWRHSGFHLREGLVVFQFAMAAMLIVGVIVVERQLDFLQSAKLGFDKEKIIVAHDFLLLYDSRNAVRAELEKLPGIQGVGVGRELGGKPDNGSFIRPMRAVGS